MPRHLLRTTLGLALDLLQVMMAYPYRARAHVCVGRDPNVDFPRPSALYFTPPPGPERIVFMFVQASLKSPEKPQQKKTSGSEEPQHQRGALQEVEKESNGQAESILKPDGTETTTQDVATEPQQEPLPPPSSSLEAVSPTRSNEGGAGTPTHPADDNGLSGTPTGSGTAGASEAVSSLPLPPPHDQEAASSATAAATS